MLMCCINLKANAQNFQLPTLQCKCSKFSTSKLTILWWLFSTFWNNHFSIFFNWPPLKLYFNVIRNLNFNNRAIFELFTQHYKFNCKLFFNLKKTKLWYLFKKLTPIIFNYLQYLNANAQNFQLQAFQHKWSKFSTSYFKI